MTTRPELPRIPSIASLSYSFHSRRSSLGNGEDVFADEHALDSPVTIDNAPLGPVPAPRHQYFDDPFHDRNASSSSVARHNNESIFADRSSTSKQRLMIDDFPSSSSGMGLGRSISTSSRLTIPRAPSPYTGPTAPSRQYEMHNQLTRSASIASQSTFRPGSETPFVFPRHGPEHPYELYTQNVAPEEDEDITTNGIPVLGFPRNFGSSSRGGSSADTGDIVGNDGHIEQLPPYTRYADNTVAKGDMNGFSTRRSSRVSRAPTTRSVATSSAEPAIPSVADSTTLLQPREQFEEETVEQRARKEGWRTSWRERARNKTPIAGMPLWGLITIILIVILSATIGGVVGGVIGNRQGAERAYANGAVTTIWLDAIPTTLGPHTSPLPTGHYQIPFNQSEEIKQCIPTNDLNAMGPAWGCMDIAYIGVNVFQDPDTNAMMAAFEDFSVNTQDFRYGPQPPDFNGTAFSLSPMQDKDAGDLGVAMFFSVLFDKLTILPEYAMDPAAFGNKKRSVDEDLIARSVASYDGKPLKPADQPWFCFWNSTINEFFIYLDKAAPNSSDTVATTTNNKLMTHTSSTVGTSVVATPYSSVTAAAMVDGSTMATGPTSGPTVFAAYAPTPVAASPTLDPKKRSYDTSAANVSNYPKLIKMLEKRKPINPAVKDYVQPYCQKMQVLWDWNIVPIAAVPTIAIQEVQFTLATSTKASTSSHHRRLRYRQARDAVSDLESYCICEWTSKQY